MFRALLRAVSSSGSLGWCNKGNTYRVVETSRRDVSTMNPPCRPVAARAQVGLPCFVGGKAVPTGTASWAAPIVAPSVRFATGVGKWGHLPAPPARLPASIFFRVGLPRSLTLAGSRRSRRSAIHADLQDELSHLLLFGPLLSQARTWQRYRARALLQGLEKPYLCAWGAGLGGDALGGPLASMVHLAQDGLIVDLWRLPSAGYGGTRLHRKRQ